MATALNNRELHRPPELSNVTVEYGEEGRVVTCFCGERVRRSVVPHFKEEHAELWQQWVETFIKLRGLGYPLKRIMRLFKAGNDKLLFSWTVIERAIRGVVETGQSPYSPPPKLAVESWQPENFNLEKSTVWDFPQRGDWAVHSGDYRGNWPPQIPRNLMERYTRQGDLVVDAFAGGGTTLIEAWLLGRRSIGLDVSKIAIATCKAKLNEMERLTAQDGRACLDPGIRPHMITGSALQLNAILAAHGVQPGEAKLVCAHPPYLNSITYTVDGVDDLSLVAEPKTFGKRMAEFALQARIVLSNEGVCAVLIGDVRKAGKTVPLGFMTLETFLTAGFTLDSIVVKTQHKDRSSEFYTGRNSGGLLMAHEYLFILRNPDNLPRDQEQEDRRGPETPIDARRRGRSRGRLGRSTDRLEET